MAELAYASVSKTDDRKVLRVQLPPPALFLSDGATPALQWSPYLAYAVGLIATDGNLSSDGRHINLTSSDMEQLQNFRRCLQISAMVSSNPPSALTKRPSYRVQFSNRVLYRQLQAIGLSPRKTASLKSLDIPLHVFRDFFRGVIDGDGSIVLYTDRYRGRKKSPDSSSDRRRSWSGTAGILWPELSLGGNQTELIFASCSRATKRQSMDFKGGFNESCGEQVNLN